MESVWQTCDGLPLFNPLRSILVMLAVVFLPHALRIPLVLIVKGGYDNLHPREQIDKSPKSPWTKMVKRATAAHQNNWEAFTYFAASAITAHVCKVDIHVSSSLCSLFIALRVLYTFLYLLGVHQAVGIVRSLVCAAGLAVSVRLSLLGLQQQGL